MQLVYNIFDFNLTEGKINLADLSIEKQSNESIFAYLE